MQIDLEIRGSKCCKTLKNVLVDTGLTFTTITQEDADEIGIPIMVLERFLRGKDASTYPVGAAAVKVEGREMLNLITISKDEKRSIGMLSLSTFRFRVDTVNGKLKYLGPPLA